MTKNIEAVLEELKKPLSATDIWDIAKTKLIVKWKSF